MKLKIISIMALLGLTISGFGQGTFQFNNSTSTLVTYQTNYYSSGNVPVPTGGGYVELLWAPLGTTDLQLFQPVPGASPVPIAIVAGRFSGGVRTIPAGSGFSGISPGAEVSAFIRGWTGTANAWNDGTLGNVGYSPIFTIDTGDPTTTPASIPGSLYASSNNQTGNAFAGLTLLIIPEPASAVLLLLSCGVLAWKRRL